MEGFSVKQLKVLLRHYGLESAGCLEKADLVRRLHEGSHGADRASCLRTLADLDDAAQREEMMSLSHKEAADLRATRQQTRSARAPKVADQQTKEAFVERVTRCGGEVATVERLLQDGADAKWADSSSTTALHIAAHAGWVELALVLIKSGAKVNARDKDGDTPLICAAFSGNQKLVSVLSEKNADLNIQGSQGMTALHVAVLTGKPTVVQVDHSPYDSLVTKH
jgi:hypothetical protein